MEVASQILPLLVGLNVAQQQIIAHTDGPLLVIAGPGSGKTSSLILRVLNLLVLEKAEPTEIILCTYTEKAAHELKARLISQAALIEYHKDLSQLRVNTIHGICNQLLTEHRHNTDLGNSYEILDEFAQRFFIYKYIHKISATAAQTIFQHTSLKRWELTIQLQRIFNQITEELISVENLSKDAMAERRHLARAYLNYQKLLQEENKVCFAFLQKKVYELLCDPGNGQRISVGIRYVCVDEYQDTNYIQEQILLRLTQQTGNLCVIGDEDQALYRFRGATVSNLLGFKERDPAPTSIDLTINYRSHETIIQAYDRWMNAYTWTDEAGQSFRFDKTIQAPIGKKDNLPYPAVCKIVGRDNFDEATQMAELIFELRTTGRIHDYSEVALLLHSVRSSYTEPYVDALKAKGISSYCPRARAYFEFPEVRLLIASFAYFLDYREEKLNNLLEEKEEEESFVDYIKRCKETPDSDYRNFSALSILLQVFIKEIECYQPGEEELESSATQRLSDYFYRIIAVEPFASWLKAESQARHLATFSHKLKHFQQVSPYRNISLENREQVKKQLFAAFLCLLHNMGLNEFEDAEQPSPVGHVQIMTIHQAKGLEFPVVIVARLHQFSNPVWENLDLSAHYPASRTFVEPKKLIGGFDTMRLFYVAFSRAENLLVLMGQKHKPTPALFQPIWQNLPCWPDVRNELARVPEPKARKQIQMKQTYSYTGDIQIYETCPRQYQFYQEYEFISFQKKEVSLGLLVHQTLEELHRRILDNGIDSVNEQVLLRICETTAYYLGKTRDEQIDELTIERAFTQVRNYFRQNRRELLQIQATEVDVTHEEEGYIISGRVDLVLERDGQLVLLDFKTAPRPPRTAEALFSYERQLCLYAHAIEKREKKPIGGLYLYWTEEPVRADALMSIAYEPERVAAMVRDFSSVVERIQERDFAVRTCPAKHVCQSCEMRHYCKNDGTLEKEQE